jgi:hypothetical protein
MGATPFCIQTEAKRKFGGSSELKYMAVVTQISSQADHH